MKRRTIQRDFKGHLIVADMCRFFRTTDVDGKWRVSTIGDYHPGGQDKADTIGIGRLYETMVFRLGREVCKCGCKAPIVAQWSELDFEGYNTKLAATRGHLKMVRRWLRKGPTKGPTKRRSIGKAK